MADGDHMEGVCEFLARSWKNTCQGASSSSSMYAPKKKLSSLKKIFFSPEASRGIEEVDPPMDIKEFPDKYEYVLPAAGRFHYDRYAVKLENTNVLTISRKVTELNWEKERNVKYLSKERGEVKGFETSVTLEPDADTDEISLDRNYYGALTVTVKKIVPPSDKPKEIYVS